MEFFCPVCQEVKEIEPEKTVVTKLGQKVYKAVCPICSQDLASVAKK